ncbi:MAG: glycoside hydrolase family 38 C-terminal domain-containing protein, partial [Bacteroidales bacterium]|nr:glycoside hydrolase family 38 C-terminal domain-containing protein [Bacteroidales bacterium]
TGTSIPEAYRFSYNDEYISLNQYEGIVRAGIKAIADGLDTRVKGEPVVVYNPISAVNRSAVEVEVDLAPGMKDIAVYRDGKRMKSQIISRDGSRLTVLFESEMAPLSVCVYELRQIAGAAKSSTALKVSGKVLENRIYRMELDSKGDIAFLRDKRNGRELVKEGESFGLALFGDNRSYNWPAWEIMKEVMDRKPSPADEDVVISIGTAGPLKASLKVERKYGDTRFIQEYTMTDGADDERIDIVTYVDWQSEGTLLKAAFPVSYDASRATYDLGIANISRGNNTDIAYETYGHQWADITADDGSYGVTVMNDSKYGWDKPDDNTLRLTLLHTPLTKEWCSNQATQDIGGHSFTYSIAGHEGVLDPSEAASLSDALNLKKAVLKVGRHSGRLGREFSMLRTDNPSLRVKALKKAQNGDGIIVRTYELSGTGSEGHVIFPAKIRYAVEVNGVEEEKAAASFSGNMLSVKADGFEPKSYRVFLEEPAIRLEAPDCKTLALPYNELAMTSDAFSSLGHMDDAWHSLAAELVPDNILCNNVLFRMGRADTWNALCCKGGSLKLPEGTKKVAMLVASSDGDRTASFGAGVKTEVKVPYYSGLYGCYGWKDYYDSFLREGDIAYVGTHRHDSRTRNEIMTYTYMFYVEVPVAEGCTELLLPDDRHVTVFAATAVKD